MIRRLAPIAAVVAATLVAASPAHAADEVGVSADGVTWTQQLAAPLFDEALRWVPGDVDEAGFLVRNDGPSPGEVVVEVLASDPDGLLVSDAFLLEARVGDGEWVEVLPGTTRLDVARLEVAEGETAEIAVRGTFSPETTDHEDEVAPFSVRVTIAESGEVGGVDAGGGGSGGGGADGAAGGAGTGLLPDTGSRLGMGLIWLAACFIGAGIALVRPRRSDPRKATHHA